MVFKLCTGGFCKKHLISVQLKQPAKGRISSCAVQAKAKNPLLSVP